MEIKSNKQNKLALFGGDKVISTEFKRYNSIGKEEVDAVNLVLKTGVLSQFLGSWSPDFFGGENVLKFENDCKSFFGVKHAITVNSWTSGLVAAIGAIGIEPGDEVIVSPWTMCASATAILQWNAIPVFADIEPETFCLDPKSIEKNITPYTKAIMSIDIFGQSANMDAINEIAKRRNLKVISDTAQAPGTFYNGKMTGTISDVGGYSLNYHKHIHTGEGGILVTNDDKIAEKLQLIRNHGEAVVAAKGSEDIVNIIGNNFRLGEIECAIGIEQIKKLTYLVKKRQDLARELSKGLSCLEGIKTPKVRENCTHAYYVFSIILDIETIGVSREKLVDALLAEGLTGLANGYANIHLLPMYQNKIAYGKNGFPWTSDICKRDVSYKKGICPVAEELHDKTHLGFELCRHELDENDIKLIVKAFKKVWENLEYLKN